MKNLYQELGLRPDADAEAIERAAAAHPGKDAGVILRNPLRKAEYDRAFHALSEIGSLRAGLEMHSPHWEREQKAFTRDARCGEEIRRCEGAQKGSKLFRLLASILVCASIVLLVRLQGWLPFGAEPESPPLRVAVSERWQDDALSGIALFQGNYYKVFDSREIADVSDWESASRFCRQHFGHLAVPESDRENSFLYAWLQSRNARDVYFGLTDKDEEGVWRTSDDRKATYLHWAPGEPNNEFGNEHYAMFYHRSPPGFWNDGNPGRNFLFVCQWDTRRNFNAYERLMKGRALSFYTEKDMPAASRPHPAPPPVSMRERAEAAAAPPSSGIAGIYSGSYEARQGTVGVTLHLRKDGHRYVGLFEFHPVNIHDANKTNSGKYAMEVHYNAFSGNILMKGKQWIVRPRHYEFVHLRGHVDGNTIEGTVFTDTETPAWKFSVIKTAEE